MGENDKQYKIAYLGHSSSMLRELCRSTDFFLCYVIFIPKRVDEVYYEILKENGITYIEIKEKLDLYAVLQREDLLPIDAMLMCKFEYILPKSYVVNNTVINFHGGDLRTNRGAHPHVWSILRGDTSTCMSMYQLTGGVDEGYLISEYWINLFDNDTPATLCQRLEDGIPVLLKKLRLFFSGRMPTKLMLGGKYLPKIEEKDYLINIETDLLESIKRKVRSQLAYSGAIVNINNIRYRTKQYKEECCPEVSEREIAFLGDNLVIRESGSCLELQCFKEEK